MNELRFHSCFFYFLCVPLMLLFNVNLKYLTAEFWNNQHGDHFRSSQISGCEILFSRRKKWRTGQRWQIYMLRRDVVDSSPSARCSASAGWSSVPPASYSKTAPPGHPVSSLAGEDNHPAESKAVHMASGLTSCHHALVDGEMIESLNVWVCLSILYAQAYHVCMCVYDSRETRNLFLLKSRSPHNKGPGRGNRNEENIIFLWPLWSATLTFHFQSSAAGRVLHSTSLMERGNAALHLSSPRLFFLPPKKG